MKNQNNYFMRWLIDSKHTPIYLQSKTPFDYKDTILQFVSLLKKDEIIKFISSEGNKAFYLSSKEVNRIITYITDVLKIADLSILTEHEKEILKNAAPWEFWTDRDIQNVITKLIRGKYNAD